MNLTVRQSPVLLVEGACRQLAKFIRGAILHDNCCVPLGRSLAAELGISGRVACESTKRLELRWRSRSCRQPESSMLKCLLLALVASASPRTPESVTNSLEKRFARITPGAFSMGQDVPAAASNGDISTHDAAINPTDWDKPPAHQVTITRCFYIVGAEFNLGHYRSSLGFLS